jgi:membrane protease YdiL (CAAX protease family)
MVDNRAIIEKRETAKLVAPRPHEADSPAKHPVPNSDKATPYRLAGLCLSIPVLLILALVYAEIAGLAAYGIAFGPARLGILFKQIADGLVAGNIVTFIGSAFASMSYLNISILIYIAIACAVLSLARFRGGPAWRTPIAWKPWSLWKAGRIFWFISIGALIFSFVSNALIAYFYPPSKDWFTVPHDNFWQACQLFVVAAICAPIAEELLFRGWIYTSLRAQFGLWIALIVSSAIFAGLHYEDTHIYALAVFPIGMALGAIRESSGSLKASICFHAFFNAVAFALAALNLG